MKRSRQLLYAVFMLSVLLVMGASNAYAESQLLTMGTGGVSGVYYPVGVAIGNLVNNARSTHGLRMAIESSTGSRYNINAVAHGELDFGIVQSDVQYQQQNDEGSFKQSRKVKKIFSVYSLFSEPIHIIARADSGIKELSDLKGKRLNIGNPGSGQLETFNVLKEVMGWADKDFSETLTLKSTEQGEALCEKKVDAIFFTVANHSKVIRTLTDSCATTFVPIDEATFEKLRNKYPGYFPSIIPGGIYKGIGRDTKTVAVHTTLITNEDVPEKTVYQVAKTVFEGLDSLKKSHEALDVLNAKNMIQSGITAPLHSGAIKYYQDAGLM